MKRSTLVRYAKRFVVMVVCAVMLFVTSQPANAFGMKSSSDASEGVAKLDQVQAESEAALTAEPRGMSEVQQKANAGLNGVQGTADAGAMQTPSDSGAATTVEKQIKNVVESVK